MAFRIAILGTITDSSYTCMILAWADQSWNARSKYRRHARMSGYGLWQIEHGVNFGSLSGMLQVSLEVTSVTTYHTRHLYDGVLLVLYVAALVASGS